MSIKLKGMTWSHPRGFDPMIACTEVYREQTGVEISWDKRSLQGFESYPVLELARQYDLIVIDHPHLGQVTTEGGLMPLDTPGRAEQLNQLEAKSVGQSFASYCWEGRQWAVPIDAATQVQAIRADLVESAPTRIDQVMTLAEKGLVLLPMRVPHTLMTFCTLAANVGPACNTTGEGRFISEEHGRDIYQLLANLARRVDPRCFDLDPIAASEIMSEPDSQHHVMPYVYGYVNYAIPGFRARPLTFVDIPAAGGDGPRGAVLGGTGIAVSAFSPESEAAADFAFWVASGPVQRGVYATAGGQPGHADAWEDDTVNAATGDFYRNTRETLELSWVRPRFNGYMWFQEAGAERLNRGLTNNDTPSVVIADLNELYERSLVR